MFVYGDTDVWRMVEIDKDGNKDKGILLVRIGDGELAHLPGGKIARDFRNAIMAFPDGHMEGDEKVLAFVAKHGGTIGQANLAWDNEVCDRFYKEHRVPHWDDVVEKLPIERAVKEARTATKN